MATTEEAGASSGLTWQPTRPLNAHRLCIRAPVCPAATLSQNPPLKLFLFLQTGTSKQLTVNKPQQRLLPGTSDGGCRQFRPAPGTDWFGFTSRKDSGCWHAEIHSTDV